MSFDPRADARAAVLAGTIATADITPTAFHLRRSAAIVRSVPAVDAPLNLDADVFRYIESIGAPASSPAGRAPSRRPDPSGWRRGRRRASRRDAGAPNADR